MALFGSTLLPAAFEVRGHSAQQSPDLHAGVACAPLGVIDAASAIAIAIAMKVNRLVFMLILLKFINEAAEYSQGLPTMRKPPATVRIRR